MILSGYRILVTVHKNIYTLKKYFTATANDKIRDRVPLDLVLPADVSEHLLLCNIKYLYPSQYIMYKNLVKYTRSIFYNKFDSGKTVGYVIPLLTQDLDRPAVVTTATDTKAQDLARLLIKISPAIKINLLSNQNLYQNPDQMGNVIIGTIPRLINHIKSIHSPGIIIYDDLHSEIDKSLQGTDNLSKLRKLIYERYNSKLIEIGIISTLDENYNMYLNEKLTGFHLYNLDNGTFQLISGNVNNDAIPLKAEFGYDFDIQTLFYKHNPKNIEHLVCKISCTGLGHKLHILYHLVKLFSIHNKCLIYVKNRHQAKVISNRFTNACRLGRDLSKSIRGNMIEEFINGNKNIFIATSTKYSRELSKIAKYIIILSPLSYNIYKNATVNFKGKCITLYNKSEYPLVVDLIKNAKKTFNVYVAPTNAEIEKASTESVVKDLVANVKNVDNNQFYTEIASQLVRKHGHAILASLLNRLVSCM